MSFLKSIRIFKVGEKIGQKGWLLFRSLRGTLTVFPGTTVCDLKGLRKVVRALWHSLQKYCLDQQLRNGGNQDLSAFHLPLRLTWTLS